MAGNVMMAGMSQLVPSRRHAVRTEREDPSRSLCVAVLMVLSLVPVGAQEKSRAGLRAPKPEMLEIDGSKNPELIPQWSAWSFAFRTMGGARDLPSSVLKLVSPSESALIMREADALQKVDARCAERMTELTQRLGKVARPVLEKQAQDLTLECRWETLYSRDRVLEGINAEAGAALVAYVESTKVGTTISLPKKALARYLKPQ